MPTIEELKRGAFLDKESINKTADKVEEALGFMLSDLGHFVYFCKGMKDNANNVSEQEWVKIWLTHFIGLAGELADSEEGLKMRDYLAAWYFMDAMGTQGKEGLANVDLNKVLNASEN